MRLARPAAAGVAFALAALLAAEGLARLQDRRNPRNQVSRLVNGRLWPLWMAEAQPTPLHPPFPVFSNSGFDDPARMAAVRAAAKLPPRGRWTEPDFLRAPEQAQASRYTVTTNSLGFRGPERAARKPAGVYRVVCLGAYQTVGHGVDDDEAFPARLERRLNEAPGRPYRFEVWNAGRHSATAIMGLALLEGELPAYEPDALILEYGFVDLNVWGDDWRLDPLLLPRADGAPGRLRAAVKAVALSVLVRSHLAVRAVSRLKERRFPAAEAGWEEAMRRILARARERGLPVILIDRAHQQGKRAAFEKLAAEGSDASFVSVKDVFDAEPAPAALEAALRAGGTWLDEFSFLGRPPLAHAAYYSSIYQLNPAGHDALARALAPRVLAQARRKRPAPSRRNS
jgi:lysophospholipase L1-like esterase